MEIPGLPVEVAFGDNEKAPDWRAHHEPDTEDDDAPLTAEEHVSLVDRLGFDPLLADASTYAPA